MMLTTRANCRRTDDDDTSTKNGPMFVTRTTTADSVDVQRSHTESGDVRNRSYRQQESSYVLRVDRPDNVPPESAVRPVGTRPCPLQRTTDSSRRTLQRHHGLRLTAVTIV